MFGSIIKNLRPGSSPEVKGLFLFKETKTMANPNNAFKVWYNNEKKWFELFTPDGVVVSRQTNVTLSSDFDRPVLATATFYVDVVTDRPEPINS